MSFIQTMLYVVGIFVVHVVNPTLNKPEVYMWRVRSGFSQASSTLKATRDDAQREEMGPVPVLCLLPQLLLSTSNVNRAVVTTKCCTS